MKNLFIFALFIPFFLTATEVEKIDGVLDKNRDGIQDVFYEYAADDTYRELVDSDYDGKVDEFCDFDSNDTVTSCTFDQDRNGISDTFVEYEDGNAVREGISINGDKAYEIIFVYDSGVLQQGYRFYERDGADKEIGVTKFEFGYPSTEVRSKTKLSRSEFSKLYWSNAKLNEKK